MAIIIFDDKMLLHTGSIIRGWHHCFVNDPNTAFVNIVLAVSMLLPYHPLCYEMKLEEGAAQSICGAWVPQKENLCMIMLLPSDSPCLQAIFRGRVEI